MGKFSANEMNMRPFHKIEDIHFTGDFFKIKIDGQFYTFKITEISEKLAQASPAERAKFKVFPSGYGIHWPTIDEDLSIDGLLGIKHQPNFGKKVASQL